MKSFKDFFESLLFEDKVDLLVSKQGEKAFTAYTNDKGSDKPELKDGEAVVRELSGWTQKYLQWLVTRYTENQFSLEDKTRVVDAMGNFSKYSKKLELRDINQHKDLSDLEDKLSQFNDNDAKSNRQLDKEKEAEMFKSKQAKIFYQDDKIKVIIPGTEEASCHFGVGTKWCTAADKNNLFNTYNKKGKLYIVIAGGEKYQFHFKTEQFMDATDRQVNLVDLVKKFPSLKDAFSDLARKDSKIKILPLIKDPTGMEILIGIDNNIDYIFSLTELDRDTQEAIIGRNPTMIPLMKAPGLFDKDLILKALVDNSYFAESWIDTYGLNEKDMLTIIKSAEPRGNKARYLSSSVDEVLAMYIKKGKEPTSEMLDIATTKSIIDIRAVEKYQDKISKDALMQFALDNASDVVKSNLPAKYKERAKWIVVGKGF